MSKPPAFAKAPARGYFIMYLVFQEAAIANIVRAYVSVKTHPTLTRIVLQGGPAAERKEGYAEWQLLEE